MADATADGAIVGIAGMRTPRFQAAYQRKLPEMERLEKSSLLVVNLDIPAIVMMVLGSRSKIGQMRQDCAEKLPDFDLSLFDEIEPLALALGYTHSLYAAASVPLLSVQELSARAVEMRQTMAMDCAALARRGLLDAGQLKALKGPVGYKNQAFDLLTLVALMRERWPRIEGKFAVTLAELEAAEWIADQLLTAVGEREQLPAVTAAAADVRRRAFTLFVNAYNELRRAAEYMRWHTGDVDALVPSLYSGRKRRERKAPADSEVALVPAPLPAATTSAVTVDPTESRTIDIPSAEVSVLVRSPRWAGRHARIGDAGGQSWLRGMSRRARTGAPSRLCEPLSHGGSRALPCCLGSASPGDLDHAACWAGLGS